MKQEKESIEAMKANKYFSTSDAEYERMKNIRTVKKGVFRDVSQVRKLPRDLSVIRRPENGALFYYG